MWVLPRRCKEPRALMINRRSRSTLWSLRRRDTSLGPMSAEQPMRKSLLTAAPSSTTTYQGDTGDFFRQGRLRWLTFYVVVDEGAAVSNDFLMGCSADIGPSEVSRLLKLHKVLRLRRLIISARGSLQRRGSTYIQRAALKHHRR